MRGHRLSPGDPTAAPRRNYPMNLTGLLAAAKPPPVVKRPGHRVTLSAMSPPPDFTALLRAVAVHADRDAFAVLFRHFAPRVKAWMLRSGSLEPAAEELAQETLLIVWRKAGLFDPARAGPATWIFAIARNLRIDAARRARHPDLPPDDPTDDPIPPALPDALIAEAERNGRVRAAFDRLPADQAAVVHLAFFDDRPHGQIERALGIPLGTVKSRLRLAMGRMRSMLEDLC